MIGSVHVHLSQHTFDHGAICVGEVRQDGEMIAPGLLQERAVGALGIPIIGEIPGLATELVRLGAADSAIVQVMLRQMDVD